MVIDEITNNIFLKKLYSDNKKVIGNGIDVTGEGLGSR